ncbi:RNA polymerase sigma factor [Streptomyces sp. LX-29]|uniref:RNA polymerase sigma factor n=1 Tax=Streptomyces sp. LX-29 TaxID=2900152 RepID=UPI00240D4495|nr:RNA polymerase sigma factor [Streptomyces sp. LX-29]WFB10479.1 RNA polymerase sigma factor [Streptomyces sp. LX-29]
MTAHSRLAPDRARTDDAALIEESAADPEVFATLYDRHAATIHRYVTRRLGQNLADDIVADTFLIAFRRRGGYDLSRPDALPWLYGITANLIGKHRRAEVRAYRALSRTGVDPVAESYTDRIDGRVSAQASGKQLAAALAALSAGDRHVLLLIAWAELTYDEVGQALGIPVGTVRSRLNRARRKMRQALGGIDPTLVQEVATHG